MGVSTIGRCARLLVTAAAAAAIVAGCRAGDTEGAVGSSSTTPHDHAAHRHDEAESINATVDPCRLVTQAEASAVLGPVSLLSEDHPTAIGVVSGQRVCALALERDSGMGANIGLTDSAAAGKFDGMQAKLGALGVEIPEMGDRAIWFETFRLLLVLDDDDLLSVQLKEPTMDFAAQKDQAIRLGRIAVGRLRTDRAQA